MPRRACLIVLTAALVLGACEPSSQEDEVAETVEGYLVAVNRNDFRRACRHVGRQLERELSRLVSDRWLGLPSYEERFGPVPCRRSHEILLAIASLDRIFGDGLDPERIGRSNEVAVLEVSIVGAEARARPAGDEHPLRLRREEDGWKIVELVFDFD